MAVHTNDTALIESANLATKAIQDSLEDGRLTDTVDPLTFHSPLAGDAVSSEGQSFVLLLEAAIREFRGYFSNNSTTTADDIDA